MKENDKENIGYCIASLCIIMTQIRFNELLLKSKVLEAIECSMDMYSWRKFESEIRTKFNVPKSVPLKF
ncbi:MAG: hypothetical protein HWN80_19225 [Candidatus Lokiarchaeota archaeon]|nr:hypothetical protein [Candidatus Lokiarchaeota archaeon]